MMGSTDTKKITLMSEHLYPDVADLPQQDCSRPMTIRFFRGQKTRFEHEYRQIREIAALLEEGFPGEQVYLLTNVLVANGEIDCVVLTKNGPLLLELKAYEGTVHGTENGPWVVDTRDGPMELQNLFISAKIRRQDFIDKMIPICKASFPHIGEPNLKKIGSWLYFCRGSTYPDGQIDFRRVKWFRVTTPENLLEKLRFLESGYSLRPEDMDAIVAGLRLQEYDLDSDRGIDEKPAIRAGNKRRNAIIAAAAIACIVLVLLVPGMQYAVGEGFRGIAGGASGAFHLISKEFFRSETIPDESEDALDYLNRIRASRGAAPLAFDDRVFRLALVRAEDMKQYGYLGYTNPATGLCANSMKERFGFSDTESLSESAYGQEIGYSRGMERQAIDAWMSDAGNRARLLSNFSSGAISCSGGYCAFLGLSEGEASAGCPVTTVRPASSSSP